MNLALNMEVDKEEAYWEQCAKINWLKKNPETLVFSTILLHNVKKEAQFVDW